MLQPDSLSLLSQTRRRIWVASLLILGLALPAGASAGKLDRVREQTKKPSKSSSSKGSSSKGSSSHSPSSYGYQSSPSDLDGGIFAFYFFSSPWWLPFQAVGDHFGRTYAFPSHPYAGGIDGYVRYEDSRLPDEQLAAPKGYRNLGGQLALRLLAEGGPVDEGLGRLTFGGRLSTNQRMELETSWTQFTEELAVGFDQLWIGDVNLVMQFAQNERVQFHSGLGVRAMLDRGEKTFGANFTYGFDVYPMRPLVLSAEMDLGNLGSAGFVQVRGTAGLVFVGMEIFAGWDGMWVGEERLGGPVLGLRAWL